MKILPFQNEFLCRIKDFLSRRDLPLSMADSLPMIGFVISYNDELIAMGFIRKVEGGYGMIDGYITDPDQPPHIRNEALDLLTYHIIKAAKDNNINNLIATTQDENTICRSLKHGFRKLPESVIVKRID